MNKIIINTIIKKWKSFEIKARGIYGFLKKVIWLAGLARVVCSNPPEKKK